jgi:hypothetical protein
MKRIKLKLSNGRGARRMNPYGWLSFLGKSGGCCCPLCGDRVWSARARAKRQGKALEREQLEATCP